MEEPAARHAAGFDPFRQSHPGIQRETRAKLGDLGLDLGLDGGIATLTTGGQAVHDLDALLRVREIVAAALPLHHRLRRRSTSPCALGKDLDVFHPTE